MRSSSSAAVVLALLVLSGSVWMAAGCNQPTRPTQAQRAQHQVGTAPAPPHNPKELGWVRWQRNFDEASALARTQGKPLFVLFQEVPGCSTCVGFGESVLSHPLMIEAIETAFVPVAIHNNKGGHDRQVLDRFSEPSWNNPVVRFLDADGRDLIPRAAGVWSTHGIAERMTQALHAAGRDVPAYLDWALQETAPAERATFSMACYWSGEACLGDIAGVVSTEAGWLGGSEVVQVYYDRDQLSEVQLREQAAARGCGQFVAQARPTRSAGEDDRKYHLMRSRWRFLNLTPLQAARINAALAHGTPIERWLSPRQQALHKQLMNANEATLSGLRRPDDVRALALYEQQLRARLRAAR